MPDEKESRAKVEIRDWPGLMTNMDRNDLEAGATADQFNAGSIRPGELTVRAGLRLVTFDP